MSREGITPELAAYSVSVSELKYSALHVSVYRGAYYTTPAAVKVLHWQPGSDYRDLEKECQTMLTLRHPHVLSLLSHFWLQKDQQAFYVIVTEWCDKDLDKDIKQRAQEAYPFTEPELLSICCQTIDALATMEQQGLAHRDLKPQNIFLSNKSIKIGDFGSASAASLEFGSIVGTPYYFSPLLKQAFHAHQTSIVHDPFKSDVYSLGLTFLVAARLDASPVFVKGVGDEEMTQEISSLSYSEELKTLLRAMLGYDEDNRWDFIQLRNWVSSRPWGLQLHQFEDTTMVKPSGIPGVSGVDETTYPIHRTGKVTEQLSFLGSQQPSNSASQDAPATDYQPQAMIPPEHPRQDTEPETYAVPSQVYVPLDTHERISKPEMTCMECKSVIDPKEKSTVQLYCHPDTDVYCSEYCFVKSLRKSQTKVCPRCGATVDDDLQKFYSEKMTNYPQCMRCGRQVNRNNEEGCVPAPCREPGHIYCSPACAAQLNDRCQLCSSNLNQSAQSAPLLQPEVRPGRSILAFLCGLCYSQTD